MSHFSVAVISESPGDVERLLEPFYEGVDADSPYAEFEENEEGDFDESQNAHGFWLNPNAKWDWYEIGGRFSGMLRLLPNREGKCGERSWTNVDQEIPSDCCDQALIKDIDLSMDNSAYDRAERFWEVVVEEMPLNPDENPRDFDSWYKKEYYIEQFKTKEEYAKHVASFSVWSLITSDGTWHENGSMGWWGMNDATYDSRMSFKEFLDKQLKENPDKWITIVDCHI